MSETERATPKVSQKVFRAWLERADGKNIVFAETAGEVEEELAYGDFFMSCRTRRDRGNALMRVSDYTNCKFREVDSDDWDHFDEWLAAQDQSSEEVDRDAA